MTARVRRGPARSTFDRASFERDLEAFHAELNDAYYRNLAGLSEELALRPIYDRHAALFERGTIDALQSAAAGARTSEAGQLRSLAAFAIEGHLEAQVADLTRQIEEAESRAVIVWRGDRIRYRAAPLRIAEIADRAERNALDASYREAMEMINPLRETRWERLHDAAVVLGHDDYVALVRSTAGFDPDALATELYRFLAESETIYFAALRRYLALIEIEAGDASAADLARLLRASGWDSWFEQRRLLPTLRATLGGLGIDLDAQANVTVDLEARPNKSPRAFCAPVRVPGDVRMVIQPRGGYHDYLAALHELGHLEHFAHVDPSLPIAFRLLGDASLTEGYAFLFDQLVNEPEWLAEVLGMADQEIAGFMDFVSFRRLYLLRRYAAKLMYELRLHRGGQPAALNRAYYAGMLGLTVGVQTPEASYLADVDDGLYAGRYLRAWMFASALASSLKRLHGDRWWRSAAAGETLKRSWSRGQEWDAEDVVAHLGYHHLDWRPVLRQIRTQLIGEMSGYGGPNITTRAGTRKV
ncbi:MAG: hypothetical protein ACR2KI_08615 [Candidatus Limnocylindria bacterium]